MIGLEQAKDVSITPDEHIDITNAHELDMKLSELYENGVKEITINFANVKFIDCYGLGKVLLANKKLSKVQGRLKIVNVTSGHIRHMLETVKLENVLCLD